MNTETNDGQQVHLNELLGVFAVGHRVMSRQYGAGTVILIDSQKLDFAGRTLPLEVKFDSGDIRFFTGTGNVWHSAVDPQFDVYAT